MYETDEVLPNVKQMIFEQFVLPKILHLSRLGVVRGFRKLKRSEITMVQEVDRGSGGIVFKGTWRNESVFSFLPFKSRKLTEMDAGTLLLKYAAFLECF